MHVNYELAHKQFLTALNNKNIFKLVDLINKPYIKEYIKTSNEYGFYPLHDAIESKNFKAVELLLSNGANPNIADENGDYPLFKAIDLKDIKLAELLIKRSADIYQRDQNGNTPMVKAVEARMKPFIELLISKGDINSIEGLIKSVQIGDIGLAKLLINKTNYKADYRNINSGLIEEAFKSGKKEIAKLLILGDKETRNNFSPQIKIPSNYETLSDKEFFNIFLNNRADINSTKAFKYAAVFANEADIKYLLKNGLDINQRDENGDTLLHIAAKYGNTELAHYLIENGINLNEDNIDGKTPLHIAAENFQKEFIEILAAHADFDPMVIDNNYKLPNVAAIEKYNELLKQDNLNEKYLEKAKDTIVFLYQTFEEYKQKKPFPYLPQDKNEFSVPELIKARSRSYNPSRRYEVDMLIDKAWQVAEEAAKYGDISLKANLTYFASHIAERLNEGKDDNKKINFIKAYAVDCGSNSICGGYCNKDDIVVAYRANNLENFSFEQSVFMHEILHDTLREVYQNDTSLPNKNIDNGNLELDSKSSSTRQLKAFAKDIRALYDVEKISNSKNTSRADELSRKYGDLIIPSFKRVSNEERDYTRDHFKNILSDVYVNKGDINNRSITVEEPYNDYTKQELTFNEITAQQEMYTYLIGKKAAEYYKDTYDNGRITKDSATVKYAPNITKSFEQDFASDILPALEEKLKLIEEGKGIKIAGIEGFKKQIEAYKEKRIKQELSNKPISNREEETKELKSWAEKFKSEEKSFGAESFIQKAKGKEPHTERFIKRSKTLEDIRAKKESTSKGHKDKVLGEKVDNKSWKK
jgi:ankyrin repeat protein